MNTKASILHTLNQSPFEKNCLNDCLRHYSEGDAILLLENGVYSALAQQSHSTQLTDKTCYAIEADIKARGLAQENLIGNIELIDFEDFVRLCTEHSLVQSWY